MHIFLLFILGEGLVIIDSTVYLLSLRLCIQVAQD